MPQIKRLGLPALVFTVMLLSSCFGLSMDIALDQNGSGTLSLEYRISKSLDNLGKLDGNERWNTIPVGQADFERTLARIPDMKLLSFSSREEQKDAVISAKMSFSSIKGLFAYLDTAGKHSSFSGDAGSGRIILNLSEGASDINPNLLKLIEDISASYKVKISMRFPGEGSLVVLDNTGKSLEAQKQSKTVSCSFPLYDVLSSAKGLNVELKW